MSLSRIKNQVAIILILLLNSVCNINNSSQDIYPVNRIFNDDTIDIVQLPWPVNAPYPSLCTFVQQPFEKPDLPFPTGDIVLSPSAYLQPVGVKEKINIHFKKTGNNDIDTLVNGNLFIKSDPNITVIEVSPVINGKSTAVIHFNTAGVHTISATMVDGVDTMNGSVAIMVYTPQLPIVELEISECLLDSILKQKNQNIKVKADLICNDVRYETSVRLYGGSSRDYPKKSFRFDLEGGRKLPDTHDHIILKSEWNDKSMLRNFLCLELFRAGTWIHTPKAELVHFRINQRYYGVMWRVERIAGDFLRTRGLDKDNCSLYKADPSDNCFTPGGTLTKLPSKSMYNCVYSMEKGTLDYADLIELIETTLLLPEEKFKAKINDVIKVNDVLVYFALMAVIQNHDHIRKNYYLYRVPDAFDNRWTIFPWDLDLTLGHLWTLTNSILDETIFVDEPLDHGANIIPINDLFSRLYKIDTYRNRFDQMVSYLLQTVFTEEFVSDRINNMLCLATPDILADCNKRADDAEYIQRVNEICSFVKDRRNYIKTKWFKMAY